MISAPPDHHLEPTVDCDLNPNVSRGDSGIFLSGLAVSPLILSGSSLSPILCRRHWETNLGVCSR